MDTQEKPATTAPTPFPAPWAAQTAPAAPTPESASVVVDAADPAPTLFAEAKEVVEVADELVDTVTATVPKAFKLRIDNFREITFKAGVQEMERAHAAHWYSHANGVRIYDPKKS
jgi:hypothetical protein